MMKTRLIAFLGILILSLTAVSMLAAQETIVTYDDMIRVASKMYCPICENEPLDECRNATCIEWKQEIQRQLEAGHSDEEIINYFVETYGQHVVGVPQDPALRFLSFVMPVLGTILALIIGIRTFSQWQKYESPAKEAQQHKQEKPTDDDYRSRLEQDIG